MPTYKYKVRDKSGRAVTGALAGDSETAVVDNLKRMGYTPVTVKLQSGKVPVGLEKHIALINRVKGEDMILFTRQMSTLLKAGLPLLSGLDAVGEQTSSSLLKEAINKIRGEIEAGSNLSQALSKHPRIFSPLYVNMVKTGEATGLLDDIMTRLAELAEYDLDIKTKIKTAVRYPMLTLGTLIIAFFVLVTFVIPRFAQLFARFDLVLPLPTKALLLIYRIVHDWWHVALVVVVAFIFGFIKFISTPFGRKLWDSFKLKFPVFGPLLLKLYMARFTMTASILIKSGVNMIDTLDLTRDIVGNTIIAGGVKKIKDSVNEGTGLAAPMKMTKLFTPMVIQMVSIGEDTGKLDELLARVSEYYDQQVNYTMKNLTTLIEPLLIFILGFMVLAVALAIFLPLWDLVNLYKAR